MVAGGDVRVRHLERGDLRRARRVLRAGFEDYPSYVALFPRRWPRRRLLSASMAATARDCLALGEVVGAWSGDALVGVACWFAPGAFPVPTTRDLSALPRTLPALLLQPTRLRRAVRAGRCLEAHHPTGGEHWYLAAVAVLPSHRGHGIGSRLLGARHRALDRDGQPAFLETADERNLAFYARHRYAVREVDAAFPGGPDQFYLWRSPRPVSG